MVGLDGNNYYCDLISLGKLPHGKQESQHESESDTKQNTMNGKLPVRLLTLLLLPLAVSMHAGADDSPSPNILLIQADDLGYSDLGIHGSTIIRTPHLDQLGEESMRFEHYYVHPLCAPTRASLLTGRHFWRVGVHGVHGGTDFMNLEHKTLAEVLAAAGYRTGMWGKWHSGKTDGYFPWDRGFEEAYMARLYVYQDNPGLLNGQPAPVKGWTPAVLTDLAVDFMQRTSDQPFFAYVSYLSPHGPWTAPAEYVAPYRQDGFGEHPSTLYGMITHLDHHIGRLLQAVDELGLRKSTLVIFMSDNGPSRRVKGQPVTDEEWLERVRPLELRGHKSSIHENGIRSPLFIRWGDRLKSGVNPQLLCVMDILPTLAELAGTTAPADLDGTSFARLLRTPAADWPDRKLVFTSAVPKLPQGMSKQQVPLEKARMRAHDQLLMLRSQEEKFIKKGEHAELYHISSDVREQNNRIAGNLELARQRRALLDHWFEETLAAPGSFSRPVMWVGLDGKATTHIPAYCVAETRGGLKNGSHSLNNWNQAGDTAVYHLDVKTAGSYAVGIEFGEMIPADMQVEVALAGRQTVCTAADGESSGLMISQERLSAAAGRNQLSVKLLTSLEQPKSMQSLELRREPGKER
ncbi:MAG: sulfatase-like hydrolase/transferase [Verrucomicrobiota bacterium]